MTSTKHFLEIKLILAEWQLTIFEHKILNLYDFYQTLFRDKIDSWGVAIDYFRTKDFKVV